MGPKVFPNESIDFDNIKDYNDTSFFDGLVLLCPPPISRLEILVATKNCSSVEFCS